MDITRITIRNYMGIGTFVADKLGKFNVIVGDNGVGKSSVLHAVLEAFKKSGIKRDWVKTGEDGTEILIECDNGDVSLDRKISPSGVNRLKVKADGQAVNAPQAYLNKLIGPFNFNPVAFFEADKPVRRKILLSCIDFHLNEEGLREALGDLEVPINLSNFDYSRHGLELLKQIQNDVYERRHEQGVILTRLKKAVEQDLLEIPETFDSEKFADFEVQTRIKELGEAQVARNDHARDLEKLEQMRLRVGQINSEIEQLQSNIEKLTTEQAVVRAHGRSLNDEAEAFQDCDVEGMQIAIDEFTANQRLVHKMDDIKRKEGEVEIENDKHRALDLLHKALTTTVPQKMLAKLNMPVKNLEIDGDDILVDSRSIDSLSTSEVVTFCLDVARATSGKVKFICADRLESLSNKTRKLFIADATGDGYMYLLTFVTDGPLAMQSTIPEYEIKKPAKTKATKAKSAGKKGTKATPAQGSIGF